MKTYIYKTQIKLIKLGTLLFHPKVYAYKRKIEPSFNYACKLLNLELNIWKNYIFVDLICLTSKSKSVWIFRRLHWWCLPIKYKSKFSPDIARYD